MKELEEGKRPVIPRGCGRGRDRGPPARIRAARRVSRGNADGVRAPRVPGRREVAEWPIEYPHFATLSVSNKHGAIH